MELLSLVYRQYCWPFIAITLLSLLSAVSGIGVIAFIINHLSNQSGIRCRSWASLSALLLLLLQITLGSQLALTTLGHHFCLTGCAAACSSNCWIPTSPVRVRAGAALASLPATSVRSPSPRAPAGAGVQGLVLTLGSHLPGLLSPALLGVTALWVTVTMVVGWLLVNWFIATWRTCARPKTGSTRTTSPSSPGARAGAQPRACPFVYHQLYEQNARDYWEQIIAPIPTT